MDIIISNACFKVGGHFVSLLIKKYIYYLVWTSKKKGKAN